MSKYGVVSDWQGAITAGYLHRDAAVVGPSPIAGIAARDEGIPVAGGPFTVLNFVGPNISAANAGASVLTITATVPPITGLLIAQAGGLYSAPAQTVLNFVTQTGVTLVQAPAGQTNVQLFDPAAFVFFGSGTSTSNGGPGTVTLGPSASTFGSSFGVAVGVNAQSISDSSVAIGPSAEAVNDQCTTLGAFARASGRRSTAVGTAVRTPGDLSGAFGADSQANSEGAYAFGNESIAESAWTLAHGQRALARETFASAFGYQAAARGESAYAFGTDSYAEGNHAYTFGTASSAVGELCLAIGFKAAAATPLDIPSDTCGFAISFPDECISAAPLNPAATPSTNFLRVKLNGKIYCLQLYPKQ